MAAILDNVTIITTSYNDSKNISKYLDNIMNQTALPKEIIIADGGSKDNTVNIISEYAQTAPAKIKILSGERLNIAQGFNKAIQNVDTTYVLITCIGNSFPYYEMVTDLFKCIDESKADIGYGILKGEDNGEFSHLYNEAFIGGKKGIPLASNRCVILRKDVFDRIGNFKENFIYAGEDADFFYRARAAKLQYAFIDKTVVYWETPNSWNEYVKQLKFYSIAELQWGKIIPQFINKNNIFMVLLLLLLTCSIFCIYNLLAFFILFIMRIAFVTIRKKISLKATFLCLSLSYIRFYYKIKLIKYAGKKYRI
jgi:GT2 family glycosyltransferase